MRNFSKLKQWSRKLSKLELLTGLLTLAFLLASIGWFRYHNRPSELTRIAISHSAPTEQTDEVPAPEAPGLLEGERINVNTASAADLTRLPGIGEKRAADIIAWRDANGPFASPQDLTKVKGIGPSILEDIEPYITVTQEEGGDS